MFWELPGYPAVRRREKAPKGCKVGRKAPADGGPLGMDTSDAIVRALTMAVSGEREVVPSGPGALGGGQPNPSKKMGS